MRTPSRSLRAREWRGGAPHLLWLILLGIAGVSCLAGASAQGGPVEQLQMRELKCLFAASASFAAAPVALEARRQACLAAYEAAIAPVLPVAGTATTEMRQLKRLFRAQRAVRRPESDAATLAEQMRQLKRRAREYARAHPSTATYLAGH